MSHQYVSNVSPVRLQCLTSASPMSHQSVLGVSPIHYPCALQHRESVVIASPVCHRLLVKASTRSRNLVKPCQNTVRVLSNLVKTLSEYCQTLSKHCQSTVKPRQNTVRVLSNLAKTLSQHCHSTVRVLSEHCQTSPKHCPSTVIALSEYCQSTPRESCTPSHVSPGRPSRVLSSHSRRVVKSSPRHSPSILQSCHRLVLALPPRPVRDDVLPSSSSSSSKRLQISLRTALKAPRIPSSRSALVSLTLKAISSSSSISSRLFILVSLLQSSHFKSSLH